MERPYSLENLIQKMICKKKAEFNGSETEFEAFLNKKLPETINSISSSVMDEIFKYCLDNKNDLKNRENKIISKINKNYKIGLNLFEGFIELNTKISSITYNKYYKIFDSIKNQVKLDTLIANHVRACQVANEIKVLVSYGFADGAFARWRTIHEICITFLYLYDSDYETIEMFNNYEIIESWKKAKEYGENYKRLDWEPLEQKEWEYLDKERKNLINKYGKEYADSYGWTMKGLQKGKRNIRELEKLVDKEYLRTIYAWSSENVHAGVSSIKKKLSLRKKEQHKFLTGPNDCGFIDPIQFTSYSLTEMSVVLLEMEDSLLNKIIKELLYFFQNELVREFERVVK